MKYINRFLPLALALALVLSLTACGGAGDSSAADLSFDETADMSDTLGEDSSAAENIWYADTPVGTELYSDDTCSVVLTALESGDSGSAMTLTLTYSGEGSLVVELTAYDTEEYDAFTQGKEDYVESQQYGRFVANGGETDREVTVQWDGAYEIFDVSVSTTTETVTDDGDSSTEIANEMESLYDATIRVTSAD
ncbi:MAG: hypothetical protein LUD78_01865 [Clostridiales bacterium]|nr:hypothetical protein [Clostridiales bacterium]